MIYSTKSLCQWLRLSYSYQKPSSLGAYIVPNFQINKGVSMIEYEHIPWSKSSYSHKRITLENHKRKDQQKNINEYIK